MCRATIAEAARWYRKAAEQGHSWAQVSIGFLHAKGLGVRTDDEEARQWYQKSAEQGNSAGQRLFGVMLAYGRGGPEDLIEAYKWYSLSLKQQPSEDGSLLAGPSGTTHDLG